MASSAIEYRTVEQCVEATIARVGKSLMVGTPIRIGKPNQLLYPFYRRALAPHFVPCGGGLYVPHASPPVLFELEEGP